MSKEALSTERGDMRPASRAEARPASRFSIHLPLPSLPIRRTQLAAQDLARRIARQDRNEVDALRHLVGSNALARPRDNGVRILSRTGLESDDRLHFLAPLL